MKLDLFHILNPFFEMTIGSRHRLREKVDQVAQTILEHTVKLTIFPSKIETYNYWKKELTGKISGTIAVWKSSQNKYLPTGDYLELIYQQYLKDDGKIPLDNTLLAKHIDNLKDEYPHLIELNKENYKKWTVQIYNFIKDLDKLISNSKTRKTKDEIYSLVDKHFPD